MIECDKYEMYSSLIACLQLFVSIDEMSVTIATIFLRLHILLLLFTILLQGLEVYFYNFVIDSLIYRQ